jgi:hypothetical protein
MNTRPTPESDKAKIAFTSLFANDDAYWIPYVVGIKLERERDEAKFDLDFRRRLGNWQSKIIDDLTSERDEARADAEKAKAYKKVLKTTNANLKRERDKAVNNYETAQLLSVRVGEQRYKLIDDMKKIYNISSFDYDTMPEAARRLYHGIVLEIADKARKSTTNPNEP